MKQNINKKNAQIFTLDIIIATLIFIIIFMIALFAYEDTRQKINLIEERNTIEIAARNAQAILFDTPGNSDWELLANTSINETIINTIGLSGESGTINTRKLIRLVELNNTHYETIKKIIGLNAPGYEYYLHIENKQDFKYYSGFLPSSAKGKIAYTYGRSDPDIANENSSGIRAYLISHNLQYDDYKEDWKGLIMNITKYEAIFFENPTVDDNDGEFNAILQNKLSSFVSGGGIYFQRGTGTMFTILNAGANDISKKDGTVIKLDPFLINVNVGDIVKTTSGHRISKTQTPDLVELVTDEQSGHSVIGYWSYGKGIAYYVANTNGTITTAGGTPREMQVRDIINLPRGNSQEINIGKNPGTQSINASQIVVIPRILVTTDEMETVDITFIAWKRCYMETCIE